MFYIPLFSILFKKLFSNANGCTFLFCCFINLHSRRTDDLSREPVSFCGNVGDGTIFRVIGGFDRAHGSVKIGIKVVSDLWLKEFEPIFMENLEEL